MSEAIAPRTPHDPKVGLVLSAGAARGLAHIGVLQVLREQGMPVDLVVGSSMGAIVGALFCYGLDLHWLVGLASRLNWRFLVRFTHPREALLRPSGLEELLRLLLRDGSFSQLRCPLAVVATDLLTGRPVVLQQGPLVPALMASAAIPGIFPPVRREGQVLVDGGVLQRLPVRLARQLGAEYVIAVDVGTTEHEAKVRGILDTLLSTLDIMEREISRVEVESADLLIRPELGEIGGTRLDQAEWLIEQGRRAAQEVIPSLKARLARDAGQPVVAPDRRVDTGRGGSV
ncbi:MAG: patatin-like phospholipase family protein [Limnochordaceae bacterium]|nr:patatin-like phospholipase family protein [Limnochordaceae bacterium]